MGPWRFGITVIVAFFTLTFAFLVAIDMYFEVHGQRPVGERIQTWSRRYPVFSSGLVLLFGMMVAHFFLNG